MDKFVRLTGIAAPMPIRVGRKGALPFAVLLALPCVVSITLMGGMLRSRWQSGQALFYSCPNNRYGISLLTMAFSCSDLIHGWRPASFRYGKVQDWRPPPHKG